MDYVVQSSISSLRTLIQALPSNGIFDGELAYQPGATDLQGNTALPQCAIFNTSASEAQFIAAVADSQLGTLLSNKTDRIVSAEAITSELTSQGVTFEDSTLTTRGPISVSEGNRESLRALKLDIADGLVSLPQLISTIDGRGVVLNNQTDLDNAYAALIARGVYLLGDQTNADSSLGEAALIIAIVNAADQSALDAIVDSRV